MNTEVLAPPRAGVAERARRTRAERIVLATLVVAVLDTGYLAQRYVVLRHGLERPGTGLCSLAPRIDCDPVLLSGPARAFFVPNAFLGLSFFLGCLGFFVVGRSLGEPFRRTVNGLLALGLGVATLVTFRFFWLLAHLDWLCPVCPWNHVLTWVGFGAACVAYRASGEGPIVVGPRITRLVAISMASAIPWLGGWYLLSGR